MTDQPFQLVNKLSEVTRLKDILEAWSKENGLTERDFSVLRLCSEELLVNIIENAYTDNEEHQIQCWAQASDDHVVLSFQDDGEMFDPTELEEPDDPEDLQSASTRGRGIAMVKTFSEEMDYDFADGLNTLHVRLRRTG